MPFHAPSHSLDLTLPPLTAVYFKPVQANASPALKGAVMGDRFICIHGHFYQPPRENPYLDEIEIQDSAYPYHDWNARITAECYTRNAAARILDDSGHIVRITNNYARMSFNFGPTLLRWMERHSPGVYAAIRQADAQSRDRFSGHGAAMAQPYNHMILPLATPADRTTQIIWGIRDFRHRFGRPPAGMWLPETAVDLETLAIMARQDIRFTILSPHQAGRVRPLGEDAWIDVGDGSIDPRRPYVQRLDDDLSISLFFYDGPISRDVAFGDLLNDGNALAARLTGALVDDREEDQLIHIAMDGETFGHHHRFGDMALAYALDKIDAGDSARLTNYAEFLEKRPPTWEVGIKENTAWSCPHGLERWKSDCGCHSGRQPQWHQGWRAPLRDALDGLRDTLNAHYDRDAPRLFREPRQIRDAYIEVILDRSRENVDRFLKRHLRHPTDQPACIRALKLLEMQRQAMLMYTSCGWFFDELSGIETVQVIQYAGRAVQLALELFAADVETPFLEKLAAAKSNIRRHRDGRHIYEKWVKPSRVDLKKAAAHYAISSFFEDYPASVSIYCYSLRNLGNRTADAGKSRLAVGRARITSQITTESETIQYAVIHMGDHNISCGIRRPGAGEYPRIARELLDMFDKSDMPGLFKLLNDRFPDGVYSLTSLFRDEKRKVLDSVLAAAQTEALTMYRQLYEHHAALMRFINDSGGPIPKALYAAGEIVINSDLNRAFGHKKLDHDVIQSLINNADRAGIALDANTLEFTLRTKLERLAERLGRRPHDVALLDRLAQGVALVDELPFSVELQDVQNRFYRLGQRALPGYRKKAQRGDDGARRWVAAFERLAEILKIRVEG